MENFNQTVVKILLLVYDLPIQLDIEDSLQSSFDCEVRVPALGSILDDVHKFGPDILIVDWSDELSNVDEALTAALAQGCRLINICSSFGQIPIAGRTGSSLELLKPFDPDELMFTVRKQLPINQFSVTAEEIASGP